MKINPKQILWNLAQGGAMSTSTLSIILRDIVLRSICPRMSELRAGKCDFFDFEDI